ncbi:hypothetical protein [Streptomyces sp. NPDC059994]|uniref:hypothetical protein n=1 Tax=Streptomyces sp. NPDC059994 TaxID=3347029 RepID=UPI0036A47C09
MATYPLGGFQVAPRFLAQADESLVGSGSEPDLNKVRVVGATTGSFVAAVVRVHTYAIVPRPSEGQVAEQEWILRLKDVQFS